MKTAIIGLGVIGKVHYEVLKKQGANIVALVDVDLSRLDGYDDVAKYADYRFMLDEVRPDVVHICTPHYLHAEMIIGALDSGANVLVEKPLCIKEEEIDAILSAEKRAKGILGVCYQNRYNDSSAYVKEYLKRRKIAVGSAILNWHRDKAYYESAEWRGKKETEGGGVAINQAIHTVDLVQWISGMPKEVRAQISNESLAGVIDVEDTFSAVLRYINGLFSICATVTAKEDYPVSITFKTESGEVVLYPDGVLINGEPVDISTDKKWYGKEVYGSGHEKLIAHFYDCVTRGEKFTIDGKEGAKSLKIVLGAYKSALGDVPVEL